MSKKKFILISMLMASFVYTPAQDSVNSSGGDVSNVSGSLSHSVGQTSYLAIEEEGSLASRIEGVQIPFEYYYQYCPEDISRDGIVDILDFLELNSAFTSTCVCREDINRDEIVDILDFLDLNSAFGNLCPVTP